MLVPHSCLDDALSESPILPNSMPPDPVQVAILAPCLANALRWCPPKGVDVYINIVSQWFMMVLTGGGDSSNMPFPQVPLQFW